MKFWCKGLYLRICLKMFDQKKSLGPQPEWLRTFRHLSADVKSSVLVHHLRLVLNTDPEWGSCFLTVVWMFLFQSRLWGSMGSRTWSTCTGWTRTTRTSDCLWDSRRPRTRASSCPPTAPKTGGSCRYSPGLHLSHCGVFMSLGCSHLSQSQISAAADLFSCHRDKSVRRFKLLGSEEMKLCCLVQHLSLSVETGPRTKQWRRKDVCSLLFVAAGKSNEKKLKTVQTEAAVNILLWAHRWFILFTD